MANQIDQQYLLHDQYKNASNLNARIQLHQRFGSNTFDWYRWVFDQYTIAPQSKILELGCGPALLWQKNLDRVADDWDIVLSDFSAGMLQEAQKNLDNKCKRGKCRQTTKIAQPHRTGNKPERCDPYQESFWYVCGLRHKMKFSL